MPHAPRQGNRRRSPGPKAKAQKPKQAPPANKQHANRKAEIEKAKADAEKADEEESGGLNLVSTIPLTLQQLLLDVFKTALLGNPVAKSEPVTQDTNPAESQPDENKDEPLDIKSLIQTIKGLLYQRDFDSAFTEAGEDLLRAYALRWSASRSLGYAGLLKGVLTWMKDEEENTRGRARSKNPCTRVVSIGGGAGAEIAALAAAWRDMGSQAQSLEERVANVSLEDKESQDEEKTEVEVQGVSAPSLSVMAVDIGNWSDVVDRLSRTITSPDVPFSQTTKYRPPLLSEKVASETFSVSFRRADVLTLPEEGLKEILLGSPSSSPFTSVLVPIMFTLNELFSTSMPKTTGFLLKMTEMLPAGAVLLVVDSPGSYSTLKLGTKGPDGEPQERNYPMKFLLDHTLLNVAKGKWECVYTQDSRWWRRDAVRLRYEVGEGAGLEDMRFQMHVYRRL
jgi:25S rRNA (uracil2843-N3)-methyltransferase